MSVQHMAVVISNFIRTREFLLSSWQPVHAIKQPNAAEISVRLTDGYPGSMTECRDDAGSVGVEA
jgi:hypothetical protein